ncbi:galactose/methyl galactoside ABC transporter permease MglC [Caproiciproducens sp. R1]|jgi:ABC-type glucose/galactose transport system, permease component|uniref:galactose/methyl galactoside ABC transporter permease MglC n=1 Tax=Caproiciproducens sp. R1 TaxID=3435000 RepID=UPI004033EE5A
MNEKTKFHPKELIINNAIYFILLALIIIIGVISPNFFSLDVFRDIFMQSSVRIVMALGCMFIIISGSADLSGGRMLGLAALVAGSLAQQASYTAKFWPRLPEMPVVVPVLASMLVGVAFGAFNGWAVSKLRVPAFLATLGSQMILFGVSSLYFNKAPNNSQPLGSFTEGFSSFGSGSVLEVPYLIIVAAVCLVAVWLLLTKTCMGKDIFAVGGNPEAARVSGISLFKMQMITFTLAGLLYGLSGSMEAARTGSATSAYGNAYELDAIASCIVGGCSITGGVGTVGGVFAGVIIFNVISYGLTFIGISPYWQNVVKGLIIIGAVALDVRKYARKD